MTDCDHHQPRRAGTVRLLVAFGVITVFMVVEAVGGFLAGSLALIADAAHMFTDSVALGLAASAQVIAGRPADAKRHFGYRRAQVLAAFVNGVFLILLLVWIGVEAVTRFLNPIEVSAGPMLTIAVLGLGANAVAFFALHGAPGHDMNIRGAMLHVISDVLGSVAAIAAAVIIMFTGWTKIDPILSVLVAALIGQSAIRLIRETSHILLEGAPSDIDLDTLVAGVKAAAPHVEDVHDVRIWQLTPEHASLSLHARIKDSLNAKRALQEIKTYLDEAYGIRQSTIQIELDDDCPDCGVDENHAHGMSFAGGKSSPRGNHGTGGGAIFAGQE